MGHAGHMEKMWNAYKILVQKLERKRSFDRPKHKWEDNIKIDRTKTPFRGVD
jgi:hypothetical protein